MKKHFVLLIFILSNLLTSAQQPFAPPGAVWQYDFWGPWGIGFLKIEYTSDTIILNLNCKKLDVTRYVWFGQSLSIHDLGSKYVYQNADTVFWLTGNQFRILYNFNSQQGNSWVVSDSGMNSDCDSSRVLVTNTGTDTINGHALRYLDVQTVLYSTLGFYGRIYERLGSIGYLFPEYADCDSGLIVDDAVYHLHCYKDSSFQVYNLDTNDCDFWFDVGAGEFYDPVRKILLFPNPASDYLELISPEPLQWYCVYNRMGELIISNSHCPDNHIQFRFDISALSPGLYFFEAGLKSGRQFIKFIRH